MKVRIRYNLTSDDPQNIVIESESIDEICQSIRDLFKATQSFVYAETDENLAWTQDSTGAIIVAPKAHEENGAKQEYTKNIELVKPS